MNDLPKIGERIVVHGITEHVAKVSAVTWLANEARYRIDLDWGEHGTSKVYDTDEDNVWYRFSSSN